MSPHDSYTTGLPLIVPELVNVPHALVMVPLLLMVAFVGDCAAVLEADSVDCTAITKVGRTADFKIVSVFIAAEFIMPGFLDNKILGTFQGGNQTTNTPHDATITTITTVGGSQAKIIIIVFSFIALAAVSPILYT